MGTHLMVMVDDRRDNMRGALLVSLILHAALFVVLVTYTLLGFTWAVGARVGSKAPPEWGRCPACREFPCPRPW